MKDIVAKTGLSKGAFYHYFDSKNQLFEEVVKYYFINDKTGHFKTLDKSSLENFYRQVIEQHFKQIASLEKKFAPIQEEQMLNRFSLIFDAINYIPNFREQFDKHNRDEMDAWKAVIANTKESGEINSRLPDEKIAKMFMYMGDGYGMHFIIMNKDTEEVKKSIKDLKSLWSDLYQLLKD